MHDTGLDRGGWPDVLDNLRQSLEAIADQEKHVPGAAIANVSEHAHPELGEGAQVRANLCEVAPALSRVR